MDIFSIIIGVIGIIVTVISIILFFKDKENKRIKILKDDNLPQTNNNFVNRSYVFREIKAKFKKNNILLIYGITHEGARPVQARARRDQEEAGAVETKKKQAQVGVVSPSPRYVCTRAYVPVIRAGSCAGGCTGWGFSTGQLFLRRVTEKYPYCQERAENQNRAVWAVSYRCWCCGCCYAAWW